MSDTSTAHIALAREHVRKGQAIVRAQRALLDRLRLFDGPTPTEVGLLRTFEETLAIFEWDLVRLEGEAADAARVGLRPVGAPVCR